MSEEIQILTRKDILRALHNSYIEKYVSACLSEKFFHHREKNLKNGDDIEKLKMQLFTAQDNIEYNEIMLKIIDGLLEDPEKTDMLGGNKEHIVTHA